MLKVITLEQDENRPEDQDYQVLGTFNDAIDTLKVYNEYHKNKSEIQWMLEDLDRAVAVTAAVNILETGLRDKMINGELEKLSHYVTAYTCITKLLISTIDRLKEDEILDEEEKTEIMIRLAGKVNALNGIMMN